MSQNYGWLPEQSTEDALHAERLLFVEERPFQRVTKRLLGEDSTIRNIPRQLPSPPPEGDDAEEAAAAAVKPVQTFSREKFWEDVLVDFAALQSSITRIQLIHSSNERERERYANEKTKILASAQAVRDNTIVLRAQLAKAQSMLELRKGYDELAGKILDDKKLKSRGEAQHDIATLEKEIEELQDEGSKIEDLWAVRQEAFEKIVEEGKQFMRVIKGVKDQPEDELHAEDGMDDEHTKLGSNIGTPLPDAADTPRPTSGEMTPLTTGDHDDVEDTGEVQHAPSKLRETELAEDAAAAEASIPNADIDMNDETEVIAPHSNQPAADSKDEEDDNVVMENVAE